MTDPHPAPQSEAAEASAATKDASAPALSGGIQDAPDPDIDDLDELDDMLDEFSSSTIDPTKPSSSGPGRPAAAPPRLPAPDEDADFENQLKREMARLLSDAEPDDPSVDARNEMASEMAKLLGGGPEAQTHPMFNTLQGLSAGAAQPQPPATDGTTTDAELAEADRSFQETLRRTMERMQASGDAASTAEAKAADKGKGAVGEMGETGENELLTQLLQEMAKAGEGGEGGAGEDEEFSKLLLGMMEQLTNKEILYEPMKELDSKFPAWIKSHEGEISDGDMKRYKEQQRLVSEIVTRYDRIGYKDEDEKDREYIVERMQKMQAAGNPPPDLTGDLKEAQELLQDPEGGCNQQ